MQTIIAQNSVIFGESSGNTSFLLSILYEDRTYSITFTVQTDIVNGLHNR